MYMNIYPFSFRWTISNPDQYPIIFYRATTPARSKPNKPAPNAAGPWTTAAPAEDEADSAEPVLDPVLEPLLTEAEEEPVAEDRLAEDVIVAVAEPVEFPAPVGVVDGAAVLDAVPEPAVAL